VAISEKAMLPRVLHMQFHGREIHTLSFISLGTKLKHKDTVCALVATGCEDGTVRLTRFVFFKRRTSVRTFKGLICI
jgi:WD repeat-containing protein 6